MFEVARSMVGCSPVRKDEQNNTTHHDIVISKVVFTEECDRTPAWYVRKFDASCSCSRAVHFVVLLQPPVRSGLHIARAR